MAVGVILRSPLTDTSTMYKLGDDGPIADSLAVKLAVENMRILRCEYACCLLKDRTERTALLRHRALRTNNAVEIMPSREAGMASDTMRRAYQTP